MRGTTTMLAVLGLLCACDGGLPIKYEICDAQGHDCSVYARFQKFEDCEAHRQLGEMLCDRSTPGRVVCTAPKERSSIASSHCTR